MKLKILHLTQFLGVGGLEKVLFLLIHEQLKAGHEVTLKVYDYEVGWVEEFRKSGIKVDTSYMKTQGFDKKLLLNLYKGLKSYDIVHTHDLNPLMYIAALKLALKLQGRAFPRLIHTAHGMNHVKRRPIYKFYESICGRMTDVTVGVSQAICQYYRELGLKKSKIVNIDNGTKIEKFTEKEREIAKQKIVQEFKFKPDSKVWIYVARIVPLKNQELILEVAKKFPDMNFLIVGPSGDAEYARKIEENCPSNVILTGGRSDINQLLIGSDYFISSSTHEGIPIAVLEAGALSLPCLLSDIPGHRAIQEGSPEKIALFFDLNDQNELLSRVNEINNNKSVASAVASGLHLHVSKNFSSTNMYHKYLAVYVGTS